MGAFIPPVIVVSLVIFTGNIIFKYNPHYMPTGKPEEYGLFEISYNVPLGSEGRATENDVCITYTKSDIDLDEYYESMVYEKDEHGNELDSDAPVEIMGKDARTLEEREDGENQGEDGEHDHAEERIQFPTDTLAGDICTYKNLVSVQGGSSIPEVLIFDAKADSTKFTSLFALGSTEKYYLIRIEN